MPDLGPDPAVGYAYVMDNEAWQRLDEDVRAYLRQRAAQGPGGPWDVPVDVARANDRAVYAALSKTPVAAVEDAHLPGPAGDIPVRVYTPRSEDLVSLDERGRPGVVVLFHGGGFVFGDLETHDEAARRTASGAGALVVSVDYRLAPEHPFPAAIEDGLAATLAVAERAADLGGDAARMIVSGDSAGGNIAAVVARRIRDLEGPELRGQLLIYPATDMRPGSAWPSRRTLASGFGLTSEVMNWFGEQYLTSLEDAAHPDASPIAAEDVTNLAPAFVLTAEFDPLLDEGRAYAELLQGKGVDVEYHEIPRTIHGAMTNPVGLESRHVIWELANAWTRRRLAL